MNTIETIKSCSKCGKLPKLIDTHIQLGTTPFIIIGESPAKDGWILSKRAFYNTQGKLQASGRVLEKLLNHIDYSIDNIYFTECCKCIIEDRKKLQVCSNNCLPILFEELKSIPCNIIITMGTNKNYKLIPIYHPSPLNPKGYKDNVPIFEMIKNKLL